MGEVVIGARAAGGDDDRGREPHERHPTDAPHDPGAPPSQPTTGEPSPRSPDPVNPREGSEGGASAVEAPIFPPAGPTPVPGGPGDGSPPDADGPGGSGGSGDNGDSASGGDGDESPEPAAKPKKKGSFWKELPLLLVIAIVLALLIKTFLVQAFSIPSESMENTIKVGDRVLVDKFTPWFGSEPERGEVVVFHDPGGWLSEAPAQSDNAIVRGIQKGMSWVGLMPSADEKDLIKRVIGVGGDHVVCCDDQGKITVNGKALNESSYLKSGSAPSTMKFDVVVPKNRLWLMGDNRANSADSRYHQDDEGNGTVDKDQVIGRAVAVVWPLNRMHWLGVPHTFDQSLGLGVIGNTPLAAGLLGTVPLVLLRRHRAGRGAEERVRTRDASGAPPA